MGNETICCICQTRKELNELDPLPQNEMRLSYNRNLINRQIKFESLSKNNIDNEINDLSLIGITDFNSTSYINVNLQILSRLKYFIDFIDIKINMMKEAQPLRNLKNIFTNLFKGFPCNSDIKNFITDIGHFEKEKESTSMIGNDALDFHVFMIEFINNLIFKDKPLLKNYDNKGKIPITNREILNKKEWFRMCFENEIQEMFYIGYMNLFSNSECAKCYNMYSKLELFCLSFIDLSSYYKSESLQENLDRTLYEAKMNLLDCDKCGIKNNVREVNQIINYPKYLLIKLPLMQGLDIDKISEIKIQKREYNLSNIIFSEIDEDSINKYTFSTKINSIWYYCNNNNVSTLKGYLLDNCYVLYFSRVEKTQ
jgi:hypothetical protein